MSLCGASRAPQYFFSSEVCKLFSSHSMPMSHSMPIVELTEFLSAQESRGFQEVVPENSEFTGHESADLDVKFLLAMLKSRHRLSRNVTIPKWVLCLYDDGTAYYTRSKCRASSARVGALRAGIMFTNLTSAKPTLVAPTDLAAYVNASKTRFIVLNVGVYAHDWQSSGHANALIIDRKRKTLDRYEPAGKLKDKYDDKISRLLSARLPGFRFTRYAEYALGEQRPQTDSYNGMCVTFSLVYVLYRLLNPDVDAEVLRRHMASFSSERIKKQALKLNRFVADTLRSYPRGDLVRQRLRERAQLIKDARWSGQTRIPVEVLQRMTPVVPLRRGGPSAKLTLVQGRVMASH